MGRNFLEQLIILERENMSIVKRGACIYASFVEILFILYGDEGDFPHHRVISNKYPLTSLTRAS